VGLFVLLNMDGANVVMSDKYTWKSARNTADPPTLPPVNVIVGFTVLGAGMPEGELAPPASDADFTPFTNTVYPVVGLRITTKWYQACCPP
jgi:hypothetical protein